MNKKDNTFLLLSLDEAKAKKVASVIGSDVCRKILDFIAERDSTESEISSQLSIPLSTVHYNLKQLVDAGLVKADEFHYSQKGKEINHYSIANKFIIIAPKSTEGIMVKIRKIIPAFVLVAGVGIAIEITRRANIGIVASSYSNKMVEYEATGGAASMKAAATSAAVQTSSSNPVALWFIGGALFALIVYLAYDVLKERFK